MVVCIRRSGWTGDQLEIGAQTRERALMGAERERRDLTESESQTCVIQ
jgi:hypothetical protein